MWVRRTVDKVSLLTVGNITYSGDPRIKVMFIYPNNWRLSVMKHFNRSFSCRTANVKRDTCKKLERSSSNSSYAVLNFPLISTFLYSFVPCISIKINPIAPDDAGLYMCQVSTHPPRVFATNLTVLGNKVQCADRTNDY